MKEIVQKNILDLPCSLHDARVNRFVIESDKVVMNFNKDISSWHNMTSTQLKVGRALAFKVWILIFVQCVFSNQMSITGLSRVKRLVSLLYVHPTWEQSSRFK